MHFLNESDTRAKLIDPAIHKRGWAEDFIRREQTAGTVEIINGKARRRSRGKMDYVLRVKINADTQPVALALIEAKKEGLPPGHGLEQAKAYASCQRLNVKFVFSSNGHLFVEFDAFTGMTSHPRPLSEFPPPEELRARYEQGMGFSLTSAAARPLLQPYAGGEGARRYYQDAAIRAVMEKIAQDVTAHKPGRALLSLATGAGKTFIAVNLLKRISDSGQYTNALFICDRDELRTQALRHFQNAFGSDAAEVYRKPDGTNNAQNARIHVATYQTLGVDSADGETNLLSEFYPENAFTHIVIDECHRSAWGKWSEVLRRNAKATQIGLTATPRKLAEAIEKEGEPGTSVSVENAFPQMTRELPFQLAADGSAFTNLPVFYTTDHASEAYSAPSKALLDDAEICADNHRHFGKPVYEYDLSQAIEDGYLAACEILKGRVNIDDTGITREEIIARHPVDALTGIPVTAEQIDELYRKTQYEDSILLPDRVLAMCKDLFNYLLESGGPEQKTIIFCARDRHADDVAVCLNNLYVAWCAAKGKPRCEAYAFKCTAASSGNDQLPDLRASTRSHFIATTVELLTTGVDVPCIRNIVFFKYLQSPISFYQMVGRGTRIDTATNKLMFRVYDYTDATRLFGEDFVTKPRPERPEPPMPPGGPDGPEPPPPPPPTEPTIIVEGFEVYVTEAGRSIVAEVDGKAMPVPLEEYRARIAQRLVSEVQTLADFRTRWIDPPSRRELIDLLNRSGYLPNVLRRVEARDDYDLYDVLAELGWGLAPRTREERALAFTYKHEEWLNSLPKTTAATLRAIARQFASGGTDVLEMRHIFQTPEVKAAGGLEALKAAGNPSSLLSETKARMFAA
jgi:type I restriction enzyme R subunit